MAGCWPRARSMTRIEGGNGVGLTARIQEYNTATGRKQCERLMPAYLLSDPVIAAFVVIPVILAATLVWATFTAWRRSGADESASRRTAVIVGVDSAVWMALTWVAASSGILQQWDRTPPPFLFVILGMVVISVILAFGGVGTRLAQHVPIWALVAIQSFRLPLELAMHALSQRDIMPMQMSYSGRNFDIVTGATAVVVAILVKQGYGGRRLVVCGTCWGSPCW